MSDNDLDPRLLAALLRAQEALKDPEERARYRKRLREEQRADRERRGLD